MGSRSFLKPNVKRGPKLSGKAKKNDQNLDFLISLKIDIWALPRRAQGLQELENDRKWLVEHNSLGSIE